MNEEYMGLFALTMRELKSEWSKCWRINPPSQISREMLQKSLLYKRRELDGRGLSRQQQRQLAQLVDEFKANSSSSRFLKRKIKSGTRLIKTWRGTRHIVLVRGDQFEYQGNLYRSLSQIASVITGSKRNGLIFFGLKSFKTDNSQP